MSPSKPEFVGGGDRSEASGLRGKIVGLLTTVFLLGVLAVVVFNSCYEYVRPNEFGIKVVKIGVNKGVQDEAYGPGYAFRIPFGVQQIHRLPQSVQVLELANSVNSSAQTVSTFIDRGAKIQTSDGFFVDVDATILYRITDPIAVFKKLGPAVAFRDLGMLPKAESVLKEALGQLTTEEFYDSQKRVEKAELAREILNEKLATEGMEVEHVLVRYFEYSPSIQQNIEDKKLQDQLVFTNKSKGQAAEQRQDLMRTKEEGEYLVKIKLEEGDAYKVEKESDRDLYTRTKEAQADLLVKTAEAQGIELKNQAMQTLGADSMVALRMAEVLEGLDTVILPAGGEAGVNPLDLDRVLEMFGVSQSAPDTEMAPPPRVPEQAAEAAVAEEVSQ
jgi:regulator of protease activity HflC (stomatin/prohibitin superfamily)